MKIIFLNCWQGTKEKELLDYFQNRQSNADVYCLQENNETLKTKLDKVFARGYKSFHLIDEKWDNFVYGKSVYYKKDLNTVKKGKVKIYGAGDRESSGSFQYLEFDGGINRFMVLNVHGKTNPGSKIDTPIRLKQSKTIIDFVKDYKLPAIVGGDFNLDITTKSVEMFEDNGFRNLIKDFNIKTTRNSLAWEEFKDEPGFVKQYFADYVFVNPNIKVKTFKVPQILISDHNPMVLEVEV